MTCYDTCLIPFILIYRCFISCCCCCSNYRQKFYSTVSEQLESRRSYRGGWYENIHRDFVNTRDTFLILTALYNTNDENTTDHEWKFLQRLNKHMTNFGQIPWGFYTHWYNGEVPVYENNGVKVVDANAQFIIMLCRYYKKQEYDISTTTDRQHGREMNQLWLSAQRAWEWLQNYIHQDVFIEPIGASWAHSITHNGNVLLTNIYIIQAIRSMELLACFNRNENQMIKFQKKHQKFMARVVPEIYKTQETLPRILAIHWNMVSTNFIPSFNAQLTEPYVPLTVRGPTEHKTTWASYIRGNGDQFTKIVWPWVGLFWIVVLAEKNKVNEVRGWWTAYMEYHKPDTIYDMYSPHTFKPINRAFLKASPMHSLSLAMQIAAGEVSFDYNRI